MSAKNFEIIVIGSGPAGFSAAIRSAQLGKRVCLIEREQTGGTCLNRGCIPTKYYWEAVHLSKKLKRSADYGFESAGKAVDLAVLKAKKQRSCELLSKGLARTIASYGIEIINGSAEFLGRQEVGVKQAGGSKITLEADKIIIAAGSRPRNLTNLRIEHQRFIDSTDLLELDKLPKSLALIGSGAIGIEFAFIFSSLGAKIKLIEKEKSILPNEDPEAQEEIRKILEKNGVEVVTGAGELEPLISGFEKVLISTGREPDLEMLNLDAAGVKYSKSGIETDAFLRTSSPNIFACGDATGRSYFAYTAQLEGAAAAANACGGGVKPEYAVFPRVVFSEPVYASVGKRESELDKASVKIGKFPLSANARSFIEGERSGWVKVLIDSKSEKIIGGTILGAGAENLITIIAMAVKTGMKYHELSRELFFHPSAAEAIFMAHEDAFNMAIELPMKAVK